MIAVSYLALFAALFWVARSCRSGSLWTKPYARTWVNRADGRKIVIEDRCKRGVRARHDPWCSLAGSKRSSRPGETCRGSGLLIGASSLFLGIGLWAGGLALALRAIGWLTLVVTLSVPSTLTLFLLLVAPMIVLLERAQRT